MTFFRAAGSRSVAAAVAIAIVASLPGCAGAPHVSPRLAEVDRVRVGPKGEVASALAPTVYARAEEERRHAQEAEAAGDGLAAELDADRALAAYDHAFVLARMARATRELADARAASRAADEEARGLATQRARAESEASELESHLSVGREALNPAVSGPADPAREAARLVAARALALDARLLCGAARLVGSDGGSTLGDAEKALSALEADLIPRAKGALVSSPIDGAARARARCLDALTHARRAVPVSQGPQAAAPTAPDALLAELSASGGLDPSRNERGVTVTLREAFSGDALTPAAQRKLGELGRVAAAHPGIAVQVIAHGIGSSGGAEDTRDHQRVDNAVRALTAGGAPVAKVEGYVAGGRAPLVDPADAAQRGRNARLEVVFVTPLN